MKGERDMAYCMDECYQVWKKDNENKLNPLTFLKYSNLAEKHILPRFGQVSVREITIQDIDVFVEEMRNNKFSEVNINLLIMLLKRFLQVADVDTVNLGLEHTVRVRADKKTIRVMNEQEQQKLEAELEQEDNGNKYLAVSLALKMGLLIGEICGLRWTDIDFTKGTVKIQNTVQRIQNNGAEGKKTILVTMPVAESTRREIPIPETLLRIFKIIQRADGYVLECKNGKIPDPRREQIRLRKLLEKIEIPSYNFYALRDTFAVKCLEKGMVVEDLSYVLGHATVTVTAERYKGFEGVGRERIMVLKGIMERV